LILQRALLVLPLILLAVAGCDRVEQLDFVIEDGDRTVGHLSMRLHPVAADGTTQVIETETRLDLRAEGKTLDLHREEHLEIDPRTGLAHTIIRRTKLGDLELVGQLHADADTVRLISLRGDRLRVALTNDLFLEDGLHYRFLLAGLESVAPDSGWRYRGVDLDQGMVVDVVAQRAPADTLSVAGRVVTAEVVDLRYPALAAGRRLWLDPGDGRLLQAVGGDGMTLRRQ